MTAADWSTDDVAEFLYLEAELLDEQAFRRWLQLLTPDMRYQIPLRLNVAAEELRTRGVTRPGQDVCWYDDDLDTLEKRVAQLETNQHWSEEPRSRTTHLVGNIRVHERRDNEAEVRSTFIVYRNRVDDETDIFAGRRADTLRLTAHGIRLAKRLVYLDQNILLAKNLTVLL